MKDILQDKSLKQQSYSVPEGYFDELKSRLKMIPAHSRRKMFHPWTWTAAAVVTILIAAGSFFLGRYTDRLDLTEEDYIVYSGEMTDVIYDEGTEQYADASAMTEDEIIEYLIHAGVEAEELEEY